MIRGKQTIWCEHKTGFAISADSILILKKFRRHLSFALIYLLLLANASGITLAWAYINNLEPYFIGKPAACLD